MHRWAAINVRIALECSSHAWHAALWTLEIDALSNNELHEQKKGNDDKNTYRKMTKASSVRITHSCHERKLLFRN